MYSARVETTAEFCIEEHQVPMKEGYWQYDFLDANIRAELKSEKRPSTTRW